MRLALDPPIEQVMEVNVSADAILRALVAGAGPSGTRTRLGRQGVRNTQEVKGFARLPCNVAIADQAQRIANRQTPKLESSATG
jgi:hypothetical protein